jgi:hypothetical protein
MPKRGEYLNKIQGSLTPFSIACQREGIGQCHGFEPPSRIGCEYVLDLSNDRTRSINGSSIGSIAQTFKKEIGRFAQSHGN